MASVGVSSVQIIDKDNEVILSGSDLEVLGHWQTDAGGEGLKCIRLKA